MADMAKLADTATLARLVADPKGVAIELGVTDEEGIRDLERLAYAAHNAVQAAGKIPIDIATLGADVLTLSAHKIGGPKGVGAIVFRTGALELADKPLRGGGQERGWRAGTENLPGIIGASVIDQDHFIGIPMLCYHRLYPAAQFRQGFVLIDQGNIDRKIH